MKTSETKSYKRGSIRLPEFDYSSENYCFITICSYEKQCIFSNVKNENICLTEIGKIINDEWENTENIRHNVKMDYYVLMPNHIHGIIVINSQATDETTVPGETTTQRGVATEKDSIRHNPSVKLKANSLGSIIGQIKSRSTKRIREMIRNPKFIVWQRNYYERIIRNEKELYEIRKYILENPLKWSLDEYYN